MKRTKDYPNTPMRDLDHSQVRTYSLHTRDGKIGIMDLGGAYQPGGSVSSLLDGFPDVLAARDLLDVANAVADARMNGRGVLLGMGAHPIKVGLGPLIVDAVMTGIFTGISTNGAAVIHDFELAMAGRTSEDVDSALKSGRFGMSCETAQVLNRAAKNAAEEGCGIGYSIGRTIEEGDLPYSSVSIFAAAYRHEIPATVHVALGSDITHLHPTFDGAATGAASLSDFRLFARQVAALSDGVFINLGSAVIIPEVFLKAYSLACNLGHSIENLTTVNMDFIQHYRPRVNIVQRPTADSGRGYSITGHHEIMFPLLLAAIKEKMS